MNTLLPNLNATPVAPAARGFQADPQPSDASQSFSNTLREVADRSNNDNTPVKSGQAAPANQSAQNAQEAQNSQNSQNADNAQNAQTTQQASDASQVDAKKDAADADKAKAKADKDAAADSADKTSSELLALVAAGQSAAQMTPQAAQPVAAPVTADIVKTDAKAKSDEAGLDADGKRGKASDLAQALPDAWNAKAGASDKGGKDAKTGPVTAFKPGSPAADNKAAANDAATGKTDAGPQLNANAAATANATTVAGAAAAATKAPTLQALTGAPATNDNAMFNPALQQVVNASAPGSAAAADKLTPTVGSPAWDGALGNKMVWMSNNGQQTATLTLNPRDLGPMQVTINVNKTQADATFIAANPEVKAALEAAMPKLREMMDQAGIQLGQTNVSTGMPNQQQQAFNQPQRSGGSGSGHRHGNGGGSDQGGDNVITTGAAAPAKGGSAGLGIVDTFV